MYPSTLCRWRVSLIALRQFTQLAQLFKSPLLCNQCITRSLFPLSIPNIRGPSSSRKKLGIPVAIFSLNADGKSSCKDRSLLPKRALATEKEQKRHLEFVMNGSVVIQFIYCTITAKFAIKKKDHEKKSENFLKHYVKSQEINNRLFYTRFASPKVIEWWN